ncbi:MAG: serine hydrolase domain-containing protein [Candidatus Acidiferrum sp.]
MLRLFFVMFAAGLVMAGLVHAQEQPADTVPANSQSTAAGAPQLTKEDLQAWLDGFVPYALQRNDIAGAVVVIVKDRKVLLEKGYGYADVARRKPMDPEHTIVGVGSVSKTFTWTAVMQLVEQGKIDLDRDINAYLDFRIPAAFGAPITMRNLMTHTAGFEERIKTWHLPGAAPRSLHDYLTQVPPPTRIYPPGKVPAYSNYGATVAGYIVQRVSGELFPDYIADHILKPLGMEHSTFWPLPKNLQPDLAKYYGLASSDTPLPPEANDDEPVGEPAGDLEATASDVSHYMLAHLQQGRYGSFQMVSAETEARMEAPAFVPIPGAPATTLGFFRDDYNGHRIIAHDGDTSGFHTDMQMLVDDHIGFFTCVNSDGVGGLLPAGSIMRVALFHEFMNRYFPADAEAETATVTTAKEDARNVAGEYEMSRRPSGTFMKVLYLAARIHIRANDDGTIETPALFNLDGNGPQKWREVGPYVWQEADGRGRLAMSVKDGRVTAWAPEYVGGFVCEPIGLLWSATLNVPLFLYAVVVLIIVVLLWPVAALVRKHYGRALDLPAAEKQARLFALLGALAGVLFVGGWIALIVGASGSLSGLHIGLDPWIRLIQLIGLLCVGEAVAALWNVWLAFKGARSAWAKVGSVILALAMLELVWFSFAFSLISVSLNY